MNKPYKTHVNNNNRVRLKILRYNGQQIKHEEKQSKCWIPAEAINVVGLIELHVSCSTSITLGKQKYSVKINCHQDCKYGGDWTFKKLWLLREESSAGTVDFKSSFYLHETGNCYNRKPFDRSEWLRNELRIHLLDKQVL